MSWYYIFWLVCCSCSLASVSLRMWKDEICTVFLILTSINLTCGKVRVLVGLCLFMDIVETRLVTIVRKGTETVQCHLALCVARALLWL